MRSQAVLSTSEPRKVLKTVVLMASSFAAIDHLWKCRQLFWIARPQGVEPCTARGRKGYREAPR